MINLNHRAMSKRRLPTVTAAQRPGREDFRKKKRGKAKKVEKKQVVSI